MSAGHIIAALWLIGLGYWILTARGNKKTVHRDKSAWRKSFIGVLIMYFVLLYFGRGMWQNQLIPENLFAEVAGVFLCALGVALAIWARRTLGTNWSASPTIKEGHELITRGPYQFVRHPIYTGILFALLGTAIAGGLAREFLLFAILSITFYLKLRIEEALMLRQFPEAYPAYRQKTKALIPFVF